MRNMFPRFSYIVRLFGLLMILPGFLSSQVVINEIMYHPSGDLGLDDDFEYIELYNKGAEEVDLTGWSITEGIAFVFPEGTAILPGGYLVIARNPDSVIDHYGITNVVGPFSGDLGEPEDEIEISDDLDDVIDVVSYGSSGDWPVEPNGLGPSLELIDPESDNNLPESWAASLIDDGTPGTVNSITNPPPSITIVEPNGGETWVQGSIHPVIWTTMAFEGAVKIELLQADEVVSVLNDSTDNTGSWSWAIPEDQPAGDDFKIRVSDEEDGNPLDESDQYFTIIQLADLPSLVITEIMYNPPVSDSDSIEFVEIYNNYTEDVNLNGYYFSEGIEFTFPEVILAPGEYVVVSQNGDDFLGLFGEPAYEWTAGDLSNAGDTLELMNPQGIVIDYVPFSNEMPWDTLADGDGPSLTLCDHSSNNQIPENWSASTEFAAVTAEGDTIWATPFEGCFIEIPKIVITEILYNPPENEPDSLEFIELYNRGAEPVNLEGIYFSSGIEYTFPEIELAPSAFIVVSKNATAIFYTFGVESFQWDDGDLPGNGELIALRDSLDRLIDWVAYSNQLPWDTLADGDGPSLTLCDPEANNAQPESWIASYELAAINQAGDSIWATPGAPCGIFIPDADFEADQTIIEQGSSVHFTDLSTNDPTSWLWHFSGGTPETSTEQNPADIVYLNSGLYDVTLFVSNQFGEDTEIKTGYIQVIFQGAAPIANFTVSDSIILVGEGVDFTDLSQNHPDTWQWEFTGGSPSSAIEEDPTNIVYNEPGIYDVKLKVTNTFGEDSLTKVAYMVVFDTIQYDLVITEIMYNPPESGTDSLEFIEIYNNGNYPVSMGGFHFTEGIDFVFPELILAPREYLVVAASSDAMSNTFGVDALQWEEGALSNSGEDIELSDFLGVVLDYLEYDDEVPWPVIADGGGPSLTLCYPQLDNALAENWSASTEFGAINTSGDTIWATPGAGCAIPPIADFTASETAIHPGDSIDFFDLSFGQVDIWNWIFESGTPTYAEFPDPAGIHYDTPGIFTVSLAVSNAYGEDSEVKNGYVFVGDSPLAEFEAEGGTQIVPGSYVTFTDLSEGPPLTWSWQFEGGIPATSTDENPVVNYASAGDFDVSLTVINPFGESEEVKTDYIHVSVGIPDALPEQSFTVYPNPSEGKVWIISPSVPVEMEVTNLFGERVRRVDLTSPAQPVELDGLSKGIYFLRLLDTGNDQIRPIKLIIH